MKLNLNKLAALRNLRLGKAWVILGVALAIGGVAALATRSFLSSQVAAIEARSKGKTVPLVVAKSDLPKGAVLSTETLAVRAIPEEYAHSTGIPPDAFERINGQVLAVPVKAGEMVLWSLLESQKPPTFSARVAAGRRAVTVPVDEINSISGMIEPGDMIDLLVSLEAAGRKQALQLLLGVRVLATGQRSVDDPRSGEKRQFSTVTLDTTPQQAHNLVLAREMGRLTALLRNPEDGASEGAAIDIASLAVQRAAPQAAAPSAEATQRRAQRSVPVLYGGRTAGPTPEAARLPAIPSDNAQPQPAQPNLSLAVKP